MGSGEVRHLTEQQPGQGVELHLDQSESCFLEGAGSKLLDIHREVAERPGSTHLQVARGSRHTWLSPQPPVWLALPH